MKKALINLTTEVHYELSLRALKEGVSLKKYIEHLCIAHAGQKQIKSHDTRH